MAIELTASFSATGSQKGNEGKFAAEKEQKIPAVGDSQNIPATDKNQERQEVLTIGQGMPSTDDTGNEDKNNISQAVSQLKDFVQNIKRELQFTVDEESGRTIIRVFDAETKELIRQIPADELQRIAAHIEDYSGILLNANA